MAIVSRDLYICASGLIMQRLATTETKHAMPIRRHRHLGAGAAIIATKMARLVLASVPDEH